MGRRKIRLGNHPIVLSEGPTGYGDQVMLFSKYPPWSFQTVRLGQSAAALVHRIYGDERDR